MFVLPIEGPPHSESPIAAKHKIEELEAQVRLLTRQLEDARLDCLAAKRGLVLAVKWPAKVSSPARTIFVPPNEEREGFVRGWNSALEACRHGVHESSRVQWVNDCNRTIIEGLLFLASNPRPTGGQERFNAEHLRQLAGELQAVVKQTLP
jgi:hypothetical protein